MEKLVYYKVQMIGPNFLTKLKKSNSALFWGLFSSELLSQKEITALIHMVPT